VIEERKNLRKKEMIQDGYLLTEDDHRIFAAMTSTQVQLSLV
jgi:hypothetical protein